MNLQLPCRHGSDEPVADKLRFHQVVLETAPAYLERFGATMPGRQRQVLQRILRCRTPALGGHLFGWHPLNPSQSNWVQLVFATPVVLWAGWPFVRGSAIAVRRRTADMNLLIGLGTLTAYLYSALATIAPATLRGAGQEAHVYFDTAVVIVALILLGRLLEARARSRTSQAMRRLLDLRPRTARRVAADGAIEEVPLAEVHPGDVLLVRPGEKVPVDGVVVWGESTGRCSPASRCRSRPAPATSSRAPP